jgi:hypothetical protein
MQIVGSGRIHHPKRAARLGTPVRSRFCNGLLAVVECAAGGAVECGLVVEDYVDGD